MVKRRNVRLLRTEAALAGLSGVLFAVTLVWRDWIEFVFGVDPDHHSGSLEWLVAAGFLVAAIVCAGLAVVEFRRPAPAPTS
jgi:hypothetical protein